MFNISLWQGRSYRWAFTERGRNAVHRDADRIDIGGSHLRWDGTAFSAELDEFTWPWFGRIRGRLRLMPTELATRTVLLDAAGWHRWWPMAPHARIEIELSQPAMRWSGNAYIDHNAGSGPLENTFRSWTWSRARLKRETVIFYDLQRRAEPPLSVALRAKADGSMEEMAEIPREVRLPRTRWRLERTTRGDADRSPELLRTMEDGPFYARSLVRSQVRGEEAIAMQETLSLDRLRNVGTRVMVPYRNPRVFEIRRRRPAD